MNLNVHVHALVLDGVYVEEDGSLRFSEAMPPTNDEMDRLLQAIDRRVHRLLARRGVLDDLRHRWSDGTTQLLFDRWSCSVGWRRSHRGRGSTSCCITASSARDRRGGHACGRAPDTPIAAGLGPTAMESSSHPAAAIPPRTNRLWAELMQQSFGFDVLVCPRCGDRLELIALIDDPKVICRIVSHLGLPADIPAARPARPPRSQLGDRIRGTTRTCRCPDGLTL